MTGSPLRQAAKRLMAATLPRRRLLVHGPTDSSVVALTFDDGPHPEHTPALLDVLQDLGVKATFFLVGEKVQRWPDLVRRIFDQGHAVGHHSYSHPPPGTLSVAEQLDEVRRTADVIERLLGAPPTLFRPPHGKLTTALLLGLWRLGQHVVLWNKDPRDYQADDQTAAAWFREHPFTGGDVVLLHDRFPIAAQTLPFAIEATWTRQPDLVFSTVEPWINA